MVKLNRMRLNDIIANFNDCVRDIDFSISCLDDDKLIANENMERLVKNSIRNGIFSIFTNTEDYLGSVLKKVGIGVTNRSLKECLLSAKQERLITPEFADCVLKNVNMRNTFSHRYNQPSTETLIEFYQDNREIFLSQIEFMKKLVSQCCVRESNSF